MRTVALLTVYFLLLLFPTFVCAQQQSAGELTAAQQKELLPLKMMDGVWRGDAWTILPDGKRLKMVQTERVGSMLDGAVKVVEGRGYDVSGKVVFNAFATISYDPASKEISMHSCAQGRVGDFTMELNDAGFVWEISAGPAKIRYVAEIRDGKWLEYGERIVPDRDPFRFFEMNLSRVGDTGWPAGGAVPMSDENEVGRTKP